MVFLLLLLLVPASLVLTTPGANGPGRPRAADGDQRTSADLMAPPPAR